MGKIDPKMLLLLFIVLLPLINTQMGQKGFTLGCLKQEREALLKFKGSVSYKDDAKVLFSWKGDDCCSWYGVTCHNSTRHVLRLDLRCDFNEAYFSHGYDTTWYPRANPLYNYGDMGWGFSSTRGLSFSELNPSLLELRQLRYLDLSGNSFNESDIPEWIGSMKHLRYLNLSWAWFGGGVPPQLGNLTRLRALDLSRNFLSYSSYLHWLSSIVNLRCLGMSYINMTTEALKSLPQVVGHLPLLDLRLSGIRIGNHLLSNIFSNSTLASRIQHLDISENSLEGSIPHILSNMTSLKFLDLSSNRLNGPIPLWLMSMRGLEFLSLADNFFSYPLFSHSALPSTIQYLDLSSTNLEGPLPLFLSNMTSLKSLDLSSTNLEGPLPLFLSNMTSLKSLDLSSTNLEGPLPLFLSNMTSLKSLDLSFNQLTGSIPLWLGNIKGFEFLDLSNSRFSHVEGGTIMGILGNLCHLKTLNLQNSVLGVNNLGLNNHENFSNCVEYDLEYLDLTFNNITNTLPNWLGEFRNLKNFKLSDGNTLYGPIPPSIGNLSSLIELDLSSCNLWGTIPTSLGSLSSLKILDLSNNLLDGSIPTSLGSLSSLEILDLSSNMLQGVVSNSHLANLSSLKYLDLSINNDLKINLNWNKMPTFQLEVLDMQSCKIENQFPQWLTMQTELWTLDLSNTGLFGEIIDWIPNVNLLEINLSNNHIMGPIPYFFPSSQLIKIDFSYNLFSGPLFNNSSSKNGVVEVPLCHLEKLEFLHLQRNQLSGTIPDCWGNSQHLSVIDLSSNKLSGSIPMTIGMLSYMEYLKLNNNSLEGTLPATLNQLSRLVILDLGENKLTGEVPNWDANSHPYLQIFIVRANHLEGVIPSRLCLLPRLQFLDLAINNLTGSIPSCFGHFKSMKSLHTDEMALAPSTYEMAPTPAAAEGPRPPESFQGENAMVVLKGEELQYTTILKLVVNLDLSSNGLVGSIPEDLTNLSGLIGLNLSNNHLTGIIPQNIGEMGSLTSLDLSNNNLSGTIPSSLSALNFLSSLNLSSNKLHGGIPTGNQLQTLNDPSIYAHNAGLCGEPLPNECGGKHGKEQQPNEEEEEVESTLEKVMFYIVVMLGFATGFWGVVGSLLYNRTWRHALFRRVEYVTDFLYVQVVVRIRRLKN